VPDPLLDDLDADQRAAVTDPRVPLAIIAPAGSGKTRVLTRRIAYRAREGIVDAPHVLALTFTRKAAGELRGRLEALGVGASVTAGTFHAVALAQLRDRAAELGREPPRLLEHKARLVPELLGRRAGATVDDVVAGIEWAQARLVSPDELPAAAAAAGNPFARPPSEIADVYRRYEAAKRTRRLLDFDDVLGVCAGTIERDPEFAATQRFRFRHLFVDEFQDATPRQLRLLRAWLGPDHDLTVVGDPSQAIYGFAGGDASPLCDFALVFPGGATVSLTRNYRATTAVAGLAGTALGPEARTTTPARAVRGRGPAPTLRAYDDDDAEAAAVAAGCWRAFSAGTAWSDIAVLFRTNAQARVLEAALARRGIPFRVAGSAFARLRPGWPRLLHWLRDRARASPAASLADLVADLAAEERLDDDPAADAALRDDRAVLLPLAREYLATDDADASVDGLVAWLDLATGRAAGGDAVALSTFHRAKGLEWSVVFVTGLEQGYVPIARATRGNGEAEERRLLHVALSRAADELHCSWARARRFGSRRSARRPSPWLADLEHAARAYAVPADELSGRLAGMRDVLAHASPPEPTRRARRTRRTR
jgi:DNA helicase-2/ATP-dependent DNA helicase PcrA